MHNTGNPLGSTQLLDLYDNSEVVDNFVNSQQDETPDRFGTKRLTLAGLIKRSMALRNEINDFSGALTFRPEWSDVPMNVSEGVGGEGGALNLQAEALGNRSEINKITSREALRRTYLEAGLNLVDGSFEQGAVLVKANDVLLQERTGKVFSGPIGTVAAGTNPTLPSSGYVSRTDVLLRNELAAAGGAGLVGFSGGDTDLFAAITVAEALRTSLRFDDFKGNTDDEKWASMIAHCNSSAVPTLNVNFTNRVHVFTTKPATLTKPFNFKGSQGRGCVLLFIECDGVFADMINYPSRQTQSTISDLVIACDSNNNYTGLYYRGATGAGPHQPALVISNVSFMGRHDLSSSTGSVGNEWTRAIHLDAVTEVFINNVFICGSRLTSSMDGLTSSVGIYANSVTGLRISETQVNTVGACSVEVTGQSEGAIIDGVTIVGSDIGILFHDLIGPANNHVISNTHISSYTKAIEFKKHGDPAVNPVAVFLSNLFLLERNGSASKVQYIGIECYSTRAVISSVVIQSNGTSTSNRRAIIVSNQGSHISDVHCYNGGTILYVDNVSNGYVYYNNVRATGQMTALLAGFKEYSIGSNIGGPGEPLSYETRADSFRVRDVQDREQYSVTGGRHRYGGGRHNPSVYHDFLTMPNGTAGFDARILVTGGDLTTAGMADMTITTKSVGFTGNIAPQTANGSTCGTSGRPWSGGFTQTAFTVTSDERSKTVPEEITDAMLDAASEVEWVLFQYLDRVEEKGTDGARWHFGAIAQRFVEAFERHDLNPFRYAFICYDEWADSPELIGEDGEVISPAVDAGSRYGIRYDQAIILKQKQIERDHKSQIDSLVARIEALEAK